MPPDRYRAQIDAVIDARPDMFTFTFGIPDAATLRRFHAAGIFTMGTATTVAEALALEAAGVGGIIAQGAEAGAHRGTFLAPVAESLVGTLALVPQVVDATRLPVFAAGGIGDGRGVAAVLALGATAAALGTTFLLAHESGAPPAHREVLAQSSARVRPCSRANFSGRSARGVPNRRHVDAARSRRHRAVSVPERDDARHPQRRRRGRQSGVPRALGRTGGAPRTRGAPAREIVRTLLDDARRALRVHPLASPQESGRNER